MIYYVPTLGSESRKLEGFLLRNHSKEYTVFFCALNMHGINLLATFRSHSSILNHLLQNCSPFIVLQRIKWQLYAIDCGRSFPGQTFIMFNSSLWL